MLVILELVREQHGVLAVAQLKLAPRSPLTGTVRVLLEQFPVGGTENKCCI